MFMNSYLNLKLQNSNQVNSARQTEQKNLRQLRHIFHSTSSITADTLVSKRGTGESSSSEKHKIFSRALSHHKKKHKKRLGFRQKLLFKFKQLEQNWTQNVQEIFHLNSVKRTSKNLLDLNSKLTCSVWLETKVWFLNFLINSKFEIYNQTFLFQKLSQILDFNETKKMHSMDLISQFFVSKKKSKTDFFNHSSKSFFSNFSGTTLVFGESKNNSQRTQLTVVVLELSQYFLKTNLYFDCKKYSNFYFILVNSLFFNTTLFLTYTLSKTYESFDVCFHSKEKSGNFKTKIFQLSNKHLRYRTENFFLSKTIFYLYNYSFFQDVYVKNSKLSFCYSNSNDTFLKILQNQILRSFGFSIIFKDKEKRLEEKFWTWNYNDPSFFSTPTKNLYLLHEHLSTSTQISSFQKTFFKLTLSNCFVLDQINSHQKFNQILTRTIAFLVYSLEFRLKREYEYRQTNSFYCNSNTQIKSFSDSKKRWCSIQFKWMQTSVVSLLWVGAAAPIFQRALTLPNGRLGALRAPIGLNASRVLESEKLESDALVSSNSKYQKNLKKVLTLNSENLVSYLMYDQIRQVFGQKTLLNFWGSFYFCSDLLIFIFSEQNVSSSLRYMQTSNSWWKQSLRFLSNSKKKSMLKNKNKEKSILCINLGSKKKLKQKQILEQLSLSQKLGSYDLLKNFKTLIQNSGSLSQYNLILKLTRLLYTSSYSYKKEWDKKTIHILDKTIFEALWKWACRRHNNKSKKWIRSKYFYRVNSNIWVFGCSEESIEFKDKITTPLKSSNSFFYLPRLSQILFHLTKCID